MRLALCCKENLYRDAIEQLFLSEEIEIATSVGKASTAISGARVHEAQVLVIVVEGLDNIDLERLRAPKGDAGYQLVLLARSQAEADGSEIPYDRVILRDSDREKLIRVLMEVTREFRPRFVVREKSPNYGTVGVLTSRENEIALKVAEGIPNRDIARDLNLAEQTVKNLVSVVMRKLGCRNRVQVALKLSKSKHPDAAVR